MLIIYQELFLQILFNLRKKHYYYHFTGEETGHTRIKQFTQVHAEPKW